MNRKNYQQSISQNELKILYESAQSRMDANRDFADKQKNVIESCPYFKTESEALSSALKKMKAEDTDCQIWAKFEKEDDVFRFVGWWIVTDDVKIKQAADYIGMAQMYDAPMLRNILYNNFSVDDVIAH